ncbi:unnamed protein product [Phytophthora lilii]|uniref:Unnamed protein product n=1 Tax=Phytophthora lilii TaxID=2077276 RepID=A0A9W6WQ77_9STRA|nr:unnamed protein product [Phytophthora lilii]
MEEDEWDDALLSEIAALESRHLQTHGRQDARRDSASAVVPSGWSCRSCTLRNEAARATCLVCSTPRYPAPATARKTVQARLSFDGSAPVAAQSNQQQDAGRSEPSPFTAREREDTGRNSQTVRTSAATTGLVPTSRRSGQAANTAREASSSPVQMPRHAAGEDVQAKTRYLDIVARSNFPQIDYEAAQSFVYPTNYSVRDYQLTIAEKALYHNTLVSLPTGLGKTLVAAVVMYNFYRWFPTGKIVFMAPTKPLVAQQIKACHEIMGIPLSDTAELQGNVPPTMRRVLWNSRRVFFCTPQSLQNDLRRGVCAAEKFVCIVVDEAHRATGNYAYCCVVQEIEAKTHFFRVLALSATPGAKFDVIQDVVTNLRISHIESRSADDPDVKKYTHARQEEVIVCRLGAQIMEVKAQLLKCFTPIVQRLLRGNIIQYGDPEKLSSWYILQAREKFRKSPNYSSNRSAESDLALLVSLLHAKSLLTGHGLSSFRDQIMNWMEERKKGKMSWSKREMLQSPEFQSLELSLAVSEGASSSTQTASHPKLVKLREVLLEHFERHAAGESSTRAIVFTQYRASVSEIVTLLRPLAPLINVQPFIGQGASGKSKENKGQTQKVQQEIVRRFRLGEFNVLVATCIAEEGLDIGEVDLIVSFDALTSPVRMIQRMGRTGRKRVGRVIILVTEGDEQKKLARSASAAKTVSRALTTFKSKFTYSKCPRMLPTGICPQLRELQMKIPIFHASQVGGKVASVAVDPDLWQLTDAERAVALMKYFPPNFASSSRNKLFPIIANRQHLLRRQPRSLLQKGVGTRIGYSARSLMLQRLVRKINDVDEVLDSDSDDEDEKNASDNNTTEVESSNVIELNSPTEKSPGSEAKNRRRLKTATNDADTDSDIGSPWREDDAPGGLDAGKECDQSVSLMDESMDGIDMHFSPHFVDSATQLPSAIEEAEQCMESRKRQQESQIPTTIAKKQKTESLNLEDSPREGCPPNGLTSVNGVPAEGMVPQAKDAQNLLEHQQITSENLETEDKSQQMSATLSLTLKSDSPRPSVKVGNFVPHGTLKRVNDATELTQQLPVAARLRRTRQLQYDAGDNDAIISDKAQSAETSQHVAPALEVELPEHETTQAGNEDSPASSFALLPSHTKDTNDEVEPNSGTENEDEVEEEPPAYSFSLLPPLDAKIKCTPSKPNLPLKPEATTSNVVGSQPVTDGTDEDEVDEANGANPTINEAAVDTRRSEALDVVDLTKSIGSDAVVKKEEQVETESALELCTTTGTKNEPTTQQAVQSQRGETEWEQEEEGRCSVCLESESYDDDPIVFCDGCNVAIHQFCYGIRVVPSDKWFCDVCTELQSGGSNAHTSQPRCQLCPLRGGAFKRTECGQWVHVQCFLWIPEFKVDQGDNDLLVLGALDRLDPDRKTLDCSLCHSTQGSGIIQCAHKRCLAAFHVSCAACAHYRMDQLDPPDGETSGTCTLFLAYCPLHRNSTAPVHLPNQQKTPPPAKHSPKPPLSATKGASPSHLLTSPTSAEAKKKFKTFRRLKRKYDASQSQMCTQPGTKVSPAGTSPWQKRIRRSKRRRETARVLAAAYIDDTAEVRGGAKDEDDDEDDYGDDYNDGADDSFINDSSQLLYSQSVVSSEDTGDNTKKTKRKKSSPNMRAIYAQSLFESQNSPLLLRRGGRQLGALPSNGIIRACLDELHKGPSAGDTPSPRPHSHSRLTGIVEHSPATPSALSAPISASATVTESDGDDSATEAETSPSFNLLATAEPIRSAQVPDKRGDEGNINADCEMAAPSWNLLDASKPQPVAVAAPSSNRDASVVATTKPATDDDMHKKIEANRLKALKKLEERRLAKLQQAQHLQRQERVLSFNSDNASHSATSGGFTSAAALISAEKQENKVAAPQFNMLQPASNDEVASPTRGVKRAATSTIDLTSLELGKSGAVRLKQSPKWIIFVNSSFASSSSFPVFLSAKSAGSAVVIDGTLEADALLSVRMAVLFLTSKQLHELAMTAPSQNVVKSRRIGTLLAMHKKIVVAVVHDGGDPAEVLPLRQLPNAAVVVQPRVDALCAHLYQLAHQELTEGYELPSPSLCRVDFDGGEVRGLDADFASRLEFFRAIPPLSFDSALSLSFRFKNFAAGQVPVLKFNEMHWRRMLPWISESTAEDIRKHVQQNVRRS